MQPRYIDTVKNHDLTWVIKEQEYYLNHYKVPSYGFETHNYYSICYNDKKSACSKNTKEKMVGTHNYDILKNLFYQEAFQYIPAKLPKGVTNRNFLIMDDDDDDQNNKYQCDLVRLIISFAYMSKAMRDEF